LALLCFAAAPGPGPYEALAQTLPVPAAAAPLSPVGSVLSGAVPRSIKIPGQWIAGRGLPGAVLLLPVLNAPPVSPAVTASAPATLPTQAPESAASPAWAAASVPTAIAAGKEAAESRPLPAEGSRASAEDASPLTLGDPAVGTLRELGSRLDRQSQAQESESRKSSLDAVFEGMRRGVSDAPAAPVPTGTLGPEKDSSPALARPIDAEADGAGASVPSAAPERERLRGRIAGGIRKAALAVREMFLGETEFTALRRPYRGRMNLVRTILVVQSVMGTALAYSTGAFVDAAIAHAGPLALAWFAGMAALTVARILTSRYNVILTERVKVGMRQDFRMTFFTHVQRLPASYAQKGDAPEITMRLLTDVGRVTTKNVDIPLQTPMLVVQLALATAFILKTSLPLALGILISLPVLSFISGRYGKNMAAQQKNISAVQADIIRLGQDLFDGNRDARATGGDAHATSVYRGRSAAYESLWLAVATLSANYGALRDFLQTAFSEMLILGAGFMSFILTGYPSVGQIMSLRGYANDLRGAFSGILDRYNEGRAADGGLSRVNELLKALTTASDAPGAKDFSGSAVSFRGVRYSLPGRGEVLRGAEFSVLPGEHVLVVGGETLSRRSLVDLLFRLDAPTAGSIHAGGADVADLKRESLIAKTAIVSGDAASFAGTLRENLLFGVAKRVADEDVLSALRRAGAGSLLAPARMPQGLDTLVEDAAGVALDAEQRQRLALARAVLRDPAVLVGEDLGVGLNTGDARGLRGDFEALSRGRTTLTFASAPENGEAYDRIVVLHDGLVAESGTHAELMALGGRYKALTEPPLIERKD
jgi:ATP-binding cassette subfamily B protein